MKILMNIKFRNARYQCEQLIFQACSGDGKVDERGFGLNLRWVVRVGKFGVKVKLEVLVKLHLRVTLKVKQIYERRFYSVNKHKPILT